MDKGAFVFGKKAKRMTRGKSDGAPVCDVSGLLTFYCPLLKLRSSSIPCETLKKRGPDGDPPTPRECTVCDGHMEWFLDPDKVDYPAPVYSTLDYMRCIIDIATGKAKASKLVEIREGLDMSVGEMAEVLGLDELGLRAAEAGKVKACILSPILGLPQYFRADPIKKKIYIYQLMMGDGGKKKLMGVIE